MTKRAWIRRRTAEVAQEVLSHDLKDLGPHMQLMCYMKAEQDYQDVIMNTFICSLCGKEEKKEISDEEAEQEYKEEFGQDAPEDKAIVCDDCYKSIMGDDRCLKS